MSVCVCVRFCVGVCWVWIKNERGFSRGVHKYIKLSYCFFIQLILGEKKIIIYLSDTTASIIIQREKKVKASRKRIFPKACIYFIFSLWNPINEKWPHSNLKKAGLRACARLCVFFMRKHIITSFIGRSARTPHKLTHKLT